MTFSQCEEFASGLKLGNHDYFNRLVRKKTQLTTPSIVCYSYTDNNELGRPFVKGIEKIYISNNPSVDIENDKELIKEKEIDEIYIRHNDENSENEAANQVLSDAKRREFEIIVKQITDYYSSRQQY